MQKQSFYKIPNKTKNMQNLRNIKIKYHATTIISFSFHKPKKYETKKTPKPLHTEMTGI